MHPVGFEPTISAGERLQTYALDRAATGTGNLGPVLHTKYYSSDQMRRMEWAGHMARTEGQEIVYYILLKIHDVERTLGSLQCRWEDNIKMDLQEVG